MGNSGNMNVTNNRTANIRPFVSDVTCIYDGESGSDLSRFNNTVVNDNTTFPGGQGQYIETKNSGSCFFSDAKFTLKIVDDSTHTDIGHVDFTEYNGWDSTSSNPDVIDVYINDNPEVPSFTAAIVVTVEDT